MIRADVFNAFLAELPIPAWSCPTDPTAVWAVPQLPGQALRHLLTKLSDLPSAELQQKLQSFLALTRQGSQVVSCEHCMGGNRALSTSG